VLLSTIKSPQIAPSTLAAPEYQPAPKPTCAESQLVYRFEFQEGENTEDPPNDPAESVDLNEQSSFELQRKRVEVDYFNKRINYGDWGSQDCQIDQV
jgi:hypothetical protein